MRSLFAYTFACLLAIAACLLASRPAFSQANPSQSATSQMAPSQATSPAPSPPPSAADPVAALLNQGDRALVSQHYEDALNAFQKANKLRHGDCAACFFGMAVVQARLGEPDDAIKSCDKALSLAKDPATLVAAHTLKGNVLQQFGDPKQLRAAEAEYRAALALDKSNANAHFNLGVALMRESQPAEGTQELQQYLKLAPNGDDATYATKVLADPKRAGQPLAPDFKVQTLDGETISLNQLSGKIVVMDFWATWCPPCVSSVPELKELTKKYSRSQLVLISISADEDQQAWRAFINKKGMEWPQYWDHDGQIRNKFGVNAFPTYLVIDQDGFIAQHIVGLNPQQSVVSRLKDTLQAMLPAQSGVGN